VYTRRWSIVAQSWSPGAWLIQVRVVQRRTLAELSTVVGSYAR
jgi:hypothetical protein